MRKAPARSGAAVQAESRGTCKYCDRDILWAKSEKGKWTPLNPHPNDDGTFALEDGVAYYVAPEYRDVPLFQFHGATCDGD